MFPLLTFSSFPGGTLTKKTSSCGTRSLLILKREEKAEDRNNTGAGLQANNIAGLIFLATLVGNLLFWAVIWACIYALIPTQCSICKKSRIQHCLLISDQQLAQKINPVLGLYAAIPHDHQMEPPSPSLSRVRAFFAW